MKKKSFKTFQEIILLLQKFWLKKGCAIIQPIDIEVGAGTFHPMTCLESLKEKDIFFAYVQPSRRPNDGRNGSNPNRLQKYYQFQVVIKPSPSNLQELYINSLKSLGINSYENDIRFVEDNWENKTIGAWGIGWEVWINGMEVTQFTYFQQIAGIKCEEITGEITYGLERLAMHIQNVENVYEIIWSKNKNKKITYKDLFYQNEMEFSQYNFHYTNKKILLNSFEEYEKESYKLINLKNPLVLPAYELLLKSIHIFNLIETRKIISVTERQQYILRIRKLTKIIANIYREQKHS